MIKFLISLCLCIAISTSCTNNAPPPSPRVKKEGLPEKFLLIGLIPEHNLFRQVERHDPLAHYLSKKIGMKVKLKVLSRYGNIIDNFVSESMDGAFFGSFTYALAHAKLKVNVLARPQMLNGESTYYGLIFVRKDSGIHTAAEMQGKVFAFVDKATTAGYLLPLAYFKKNGIENYKTHFRETYFAGTHEDVIYDILNQKADIGAAKSTVYKRLTQTDSRLVQELVVVDRSPDVPENGLAVRQDLDDTLKKKLKEALLTMHTDREGQGLLEKFGAQKFIETSDQDYVPVYRYAREINLMLTTYDYRNE